MSKAAFTINGSPSVDPTTGDPGYVATNSENLQCTLEQNPASGVLSTRYEIFDPADTESPLSSYEAPDLTWTQNASAAYIPPSVNGNANVVMPAVGLHSYIIRCTVSTAQGPEVFERLVAIVAGSTPAARKFVPGESTQFRARGYADDLSALVDATASAPSRYDFGAGSSGLITDVSVSQIKVRRAPVAQNWTFRALVSAVTGRSIYVTLRDVTAGLDVLVLGPVAGVVPTEVSLAFPAPLVDTVYSVKIRIDAAASNTDRCFLYDASIERI